MIYFKTYNFHRALTKNISYLFIHNVQVPLTRNWKLRCVIVFEYSNSIDMNKWDMFRMWHFKVDTIVRLRFPNCKPTSITICHNQVSQYSQLFNFTYLAGPYCVHIKIMSTHRDDNLTFPSFNNSSRHENENYFWWDVEHIIVRRKINNIDHTKLPLSSNFSHRGL